MNMYLGIQPFVSFHLINMTFFAGSKIWLWNCSQGQSRNIGITRFFHEEPFYKESTCRRSIFYFKDKIPKEPFNAYINLFSTFIAFWPRFLATVESKIQNFDVFLASVLFRALNMQLKLRSY